MSYWRLKRQRSALARSFEHRKMKGICNGCRTPVADIKGVAAAFVDLQQSRHLADYDSSKTWTRMEANSEVERARAAFQMWRKARTRSEAQDFLLSLFAADRR